MSVDWQAMFSPEHSLIEIFLRGTIMYIVLFSILRFFMKRQSGVIGIADLLVIVLIADAAQNAMANEYKSITEGVLLVLSIVFWNFAIDWLGYHIPLIQRFTRPPPLQLIKDGQLLHRNMRQEMITREELLSQLRQEGIEDPVQVKKAFIEGDGRISIIRADNGDTGRQNNDPREIT
ncbi:DUF421 domain-containing protein [Microvirga makkahensis]|uniref:DUF421 domain-containing protein n=1 Tax=Microvirga makkahensis TaxID=1128670 RepID=A0A7X3MX10_9HYPH|nr:YetF domain-containing protein [Microvirga makkahensis]MXQ14812.1 DUF421 domain-containing protein [Microvirga makkahensis]